MQFKIQSVIKALDVHELKKNNYNNPIKLNVRNSLILSTRD